MNKGKRRTMSHIKGEQAVNLLKNHFPDSWVVREYTPDYGIDLSVELFNQCGNDYITKGEHIFFQVKGTADIQIESFKVKERNNVEKEYLISEKDVVNINVIKFVIETELLFTVEKMGSAVPVILCVVDLKTENSYFVCLNDYIEKIIVPMDSTYFNKKTPLYNFLTQKMPYETLWCIISLHPKIYERSDLIRQIYYTTTNT